MPLASAQARVPKIELLDAGDLGGEPRRPALAGGIWAEAPLILGVEPELDRTFLFRLGGLSPEPGTPPGQRDAVVPADGQNPPPGRDLAAILPDARPGPAAVAAPAGPPASAPEAEPANGRRPVSLDGAAAPALPEILAFPPLPPGVLEMAVGGTGHNNIVVWAAAEGPDGAPGKRLSARRIGADGRPLGPDLTLQAGPSRPADLAVAVAPDGEAIVAWTNHLPGRGAGLRWRSIGSGDSLGLPRTDWDIASDQGSPSLAVVPGGFALAYLSTALEGEQAGGERPERKPAADPADAESGVEPGTPEREIRLRRLAPSGGAMRGEPVVVAARKGLDHPAAVSRGSAISLFWTDPRGGGRMLRNRTYSADGTPFGPEGALRTDLRMLDTAPYRVAPAGDGYWLVMRPQLEGRGKSMVLEARLFHPAGNAAGPPLLVARSLGPIAMRDLIESPSADRWIALWTEEEAGQFRLRYRPMRRDPRG